MSEPRPPITTPWAPRGPEPNREIDEHDAALRREGVTRRAFLRYLGWGGAAATGLGFAADVLGVTSFVEAGHDEADAETLERLASLVGASDGGGIALVPARDHPFKPLAPTQPAYAIEAECMKAYAGRFWPDANVRQVRGYPRLRADDSVVLLGSPVSNLVSRQHFGNPFRDLPEQYARYGASNELSIRLRWALHSPLEAADLAFDQYGTRWLTKEHRLRDFANRETLSAAVGDSEPTTDYLLLTAIPRFADGPQRIVMFSGLHGAGTRGAALLLKQPHRPDLKDLEQHLQGHPYFQALFEVTVKPRGGELEPTRLRLVDATRLYIEDQRPGT